MIETHAALKKQNDESSRAQVDADIEEVSEVEQTSPLTGRQGSQADVPRVTPSNILSLQRTIGNQAVQRLLSEQRRNTSNSRTINRKFAPKAPINLFGNKQEEATESETDTEIDNADPQSFNDTKPVQRKVADHTLDEENEGEEALTATSDQAESQSGEANIATAQPVQRTTEHAQPAQPIQRAVEESQIIQFNNAAQPAAVQPVVQNTVSRQVAPSPSAATIQPVAGAAQTVARVDSPGMKFVKGEYPEAQTTAGKVGVVFLKIGEGIFNGAFGVVNPRFWTKAVLDIKNTRGKDYGGGKVGGFFKWLSRTSQVAQKVAAVAGVVALVTGIAGAVLTAANGAGAALMVAAAISSFIAMIASGIAAILQLALFLKNAIGYAGKSSDEKKRMWGDLAGMIGSVIGAVFSGLGANFGAQGLNMGGTGVFDSATSGLQGASSAFAGQGLGQIGGTVGDTTGAILDVHSSSLSSPTPTTPTPTTPTAPPLPTTPSPITPPMPTTPPPMPPLPTTPSSTPPTTPPPPIPTRPSSTMPTTPPPLPPLSTMPTTPPPLPPLPRMPTTPPPPLPTTATTASSRPPSTPPPLPPLPSTPPPLPTTPPPVLQPKRLDTEQLSVISREVGDTAPAPTASEGTEVSLVDLQEFASTVIGEAGVAKQESVGDIEGYTKASKGIEDTQAALVAPPDTSAAPSGAKTYAKESVPVSAGLSALPGKLEEAQSSLDMNETTLKTTKGDLKGSESKLNTVETDLKKAEGEIGIDSSAHEPPKKPSLFSRFKSWLKTKFNFIKERIKKLAAKAKAKLVSIAMDALGMTTQMEEFKGAMSEQNAQTPQAIQDASATSTSATQAEELAKQLDKATKSGK